MCVRVSCRRRRHSRSVAGGGCRCLGVRVRAADGFTQSVVWKVSNRARWMGRRGEEHTRAANAEPAEQPNHRRKTERNENPREPPEGPGTEPTEPNATRCKKSSHIQSQNETKRQRLRSNGLFLSGNRRQQEKKTMKLMNLKLKNMMEKNLLILMYDY